MYKLVVLEDIVRVPPNRFSEPLKEVIEDILRTGYMFSGKSEGGYEGMLDRDLGMVLAVTGVKEIGTGNIIPGDGGVYYNTTFEVLTFNAELHEIFEGEIVDIVEFGAFMRFGPLDGLIHVSQITDDYIIHDEKRVALLGKESNKALEIGDKVRARVVAISLKPEKSKENKINLTMRQPSLGKFEWLEEGKKKEKIKKGEKEVEKEAKPEKKEKKPKKKVKEKKTGGKEEGGK